MPKKEDKNSLKIENREKLIDELVAAGVEISDINDEMLFLLQKRLQEYAKSKKKSEVEAISYLPKIDLLKEMGRGNFNSSKYYFLLDYESEGWFGIEIYQEESYSAIEAEEILAEYEHTLSSIERELFIFIRDANFWGDEMKYGELFRLLRDSRIRLYREYADEENELSFVKKPKKIKAEMLYDSKFNQFVFKIDNQKKGSRFFCDKRNIVEIEANDISIHPTSAEINQIFSRILKSNEKFFNQEESFVALNEDEILNINIILAAAREFFDFKTELPSSYKIEEYRQAQNCILVDYDSEREQLNVSFAIDYGSRIVDVSKTVYYSRVKHMEGFRFRKKKSEVEVESNKKYIMQISDSSISYAKQTKKAELELFKKIYTSREQLGLNKNAIFSAHGKKKIENFLGKYWPRIKDTGYKVIYTKDQLEFSDTNFKADFSVDLNAVNDWLSFDVDCYCGDDKISMEELKHFVLEKKDYVRAKDGRMLRIKNRKELEKFVMMISSFHEREGEKYVGKLYHAPELSQVFADSEYYTGNLSASFNKFITEVNSGKAVEAVSFDAKVNKVLRTYQKEGINWLYFLRKYRFAGILADDMGLGKTLQSLILLEKEKVDGKLSIVVCPKTLLYNWQNEVKKFTPNLRAVVVDGTIEERERKLKNINNYDLLITSYSTLRNDFKKYKKAGLKFNYCVLDEAQFIKNYRTKNAQVVKLIDADYRLALTGTPLENSVAEIWSIFDFLMPGFLGSNKVFMERFQNPIMKNNDRQALTALRRKIECFMLRRTKKEVLKELPEKIEQVSRCQLENDQNILYQEVLSSVRSKIFSEVESSGYHKAYLHILAGLMKLRQVCNHPVLVLKDKQYQKYESAKLNMFIELIEGIVAAKRKVLVFSQFTSMLDILAKVLEEREIEYSYLSGKTRDRQSVVEKFKKDENCRVFLISLKAGGTGLNLTEADNVIIFDPWWNPSVENQAIDRTHRIGQKKSVNVYRLITTGTIEEKIVELQKRKQFLFDNLVSESEDMFQKLTWEDVQELFAK